MATVNENDPRLKGIEEQKNQALQDSNNLYQGMIDSSQQYYDAQIEASKQWAEKQSELQQQRTDFQIEQIEQQKQQADKDYTKEQKASYQDYMKQQNAYGSQNQAMGQRGLGSSGWSETTQSGYWNTYQSRVSTARESYNNIILDYNNGIKEAQLANSSALAQLAYEAQQKQLELSLQGFEYKNQLLLQQEEAQRSIDKDYSDRWNTVWNQLYQEAKDQEEWLKWTREMELKLQQMEQEQQRWEKEYELSKQEVALQRQQAYSNYSLSGGSGSLNNSSSADAYGNTTARNKSDYYFSNGYQPQYINNQKLKAVSTVKKVFGSSAPVKGSQNVWQAGNKYYVWVGNGKGGGSYVDITSKYQSHKKNKWCVIW